MDLVTLSRLQANYKLDGKTTFQGLPISIENRKGSVRKGKCEEGKPWSCWKTKMSAHYGYIRGVPGVDGDALDCFIGPNSKAKTAFVVHTLKAPEFKVHDEDKVMLGWDSAEAAKKALIANYGGDARHFGSMDAIPFEEFKQRVTHENFYPQKLTASKLAAAMEMMAGGPGSGCKGPNCGRKAYKELINEHNRIKNHPMRARESFDRDKLYRMQKGALESLADRIESAFGEKFKDTDTIGDLHEARKSLRAAENSYAKGNMVSAVSKQEDALMLLHDTLRGIKNWKYGSMWANIGEPGVYEGGMAHLESTPTFHPPSLKKAKRVPADQPGETDDKFLDVTKRNSKATKRMRDERTRRVAVPTQLPGGNTAVQHHTAVNIPWAPTQ